MTLRAKQKAALCKEEVESVVGRSVEDSSIDFSLADV